MQTLVCTANLRLETDYKQRCFDFVCFQIGGLFTRVSTLTFYDEVVRQSYVLRIRQEFLGLDPEGKEIIVNTELEGTSPIVDPDAQVVFKDYKQEYTHEAAGLIRSSGDINYEVTSVDNSQAFTSYRIYYSDEITFSECPHLVDHSASMIRVNSKRVYVKYTKGDNLVRFTSANYMYPRGTCIYKLICLSFRIFSLLKCHFLKIHEMILAKWTPAVSTPNVLSTTKRPIITHASAKLASKEMASIVMVSSILN